MEITGTTDNSNSPKTGFNGLVKVCGMRNPSNIVEVSALNPDFLGFIFYSKSPRYVNEPDLVTISTLSTNIKKIGVFVNEDIEHILTTTHKYKLDGVQLHGSENVELCKKLKDSGLLIIKAFAIEAGYNLKVTNTYEGFCDYYLFDTKTQTFGGSGQKFDWNILSEYKGQTPFLLSGGISLNDADTILDINHPKFVGIDLNSKFEIEPGLKDVNLLNKFLKHIKR